MLKRVSLLGAGFTLLAYIIQMLAGAPPEVERVVRWALILSVVLYGVVILVQIPEQFRRAWRDREKTQ